MLVLLLALPCLAGADIVPYAYDNGVSVYGIQSSAAYAYANYFTIDPGAPVTVNAVRIFREIPFWGPNELADIYVWADAGGTPGAVLGQRLSESLPDIYSWNVVDFSSFDIALAPGQGVFVGYHPITLDAVYDGQNPGAGRSYWRYADWTDWELGAPAQIPSNLMVRLDVETQSVPEPGSLYLLGVALALVPVARRGYGRRRRH